MQTKHSNSRGFTLLEILLVVGIIAILAGIVIVAINPAKQLAQVRNTERKSDIKQIDSAILQYYIDNFDYPSDITSTLTEVCNTGAVSSTTDSIYGNDCATLINLSSLVPDYITSIPVDPKATSSYDGTGYYVKEDATTHKLGTKALLAELEQDININAASGTVSEVAVDLGDHLVAHWKMNEISGTTVHDSLGNYDGYLTNSANSVSGATINTGTALSFDGSSDSIVVPNFPSYNKNFTISMWLYENGSGAYKPYSGFARIDGFFGWAYNYSESKFDMWYNSDTTWYAPSDIKDRWALVTVVFDNSAVLHLYVDGNEIASRETTEMSGSGTSNLYLGAYPDDSQYTDGYIDDIRFYDKALSQDEISALAAGTEAE